jgi:hypothetical protein
MALDKDLIDATVEDLLVSAGTWVGSARIAVGVLAALGRRRPSRAFAATLQEVLTEMVEYNTLLPRTSAEGLTEFILRDLFFQGKRSLARLTPFEQGQGVLVFGHRFVPFVDPGVPGLVEVLFEGEPLPVKRVRLRLAESAEYCSLLGKVGWFEHVIEENSEAAFGRALSSNGPVELPAFDLKPVLRRYPGATSFVFECLDSLDGRVGIVAGRGLEAPVDFAAAAAACQALDEAFAAVFAQYEPETIRIPEQIALAYARMPDSFFAEPPLHFGGYLQQSRKVGFADAFLDTILWHKGQDPKEAISAEARQEVEETLRELRTLLEQEDASGEPAGDRKKGSKRPSGSGAAKARATGQGTGGASPRQAAAGIKATGSQVYTLDVALDGRKHIRRQVEVHARNTWEELHEAIFDAFEREEEHLYCFHLTRVACPSVHKRYSAPRIEFGGDGEAGPGSRDASSRRIGEDGLRVKEKLYYLFDYGDEWWHEITVVACEERSGEDPASYPRLIGGQGDSPPQYPDLDEE